MFALIDGHVNDHDNRNLIHDYFEFGPSFFVFFALWAYKYHLQIKHIDSIWHYRSLLGQEKLTAEQAKILKIREAFLTVVTPGFDKFGGALVGWGLVDGRAVVTDSTLHRKLYAWLLHSRLNFRPAGRS